MFIVLQPGPNPPGDDLKTMLVQLALGMLSYQHSVPLLPSVACCSPKLLQFPRSPNSSHGSLTCGVPDHPMLVVSSAALVSPSRIMQGFSQTCHCGRVFSHTYALTNHEQTCKKSKKRLSHALAMAKEVWQTRKKRRCVPDAEADSIAGQNAQPEAVAAIVPESHIVDVCLPCLCFESPLTRFVPR